MPVRPRGVSLPEYRCRWLANNLSSAALNSVASSHINSSLVVQEGGGHSRPVLGWASAIIANISAIALARRSRRGEVIIAGPSFKSVARQRGGPRRAGHVARNISSKLRHILARTKTFALCGNGATWQAVAPPQRESIALPPQAEASLNEKILMAPHLQIARTAIEKSDLRFNGMPR